MTDHQGYFITMDNDDDSISACTKPWNDSKIDRPYTLNDARIKLWNLIRNTPSLTWLLLTKRPENIIRMMPEGNWPNVWLGVSVENQEYTWRLDALQEVRNKINCPVLFCSAEPLIGSLDLSGTLSPQGISWVIVGGESGAYDKVRPFSISWARSLIKQCQEAGVACFIKQLGRKRMGLSVPLTTSDDKGSDENDWPEDVRVREFPL